jgi:hypothetical protein
VRHGDSPLYIMYRAAAAAVCVCCDGFLLL